MSMRWYNAGKQKEEKHVIHDSLPEQTFHVRIQSQSAKRKTQHGYHPPTPPHTHTQQYLPSLPQSPFSIIIITNSQIIIKDASIQLCISWYSFQFY